MLVVHFIVNFADSQIPTDLIVKKFDILATPLGSLPVLQYDGVELSQSFAIARFLAKVTGLYGNTYQEQGYADMAADMVTDYHDGKEISVFGRFLSTRNLSTKNQGKSN